MHTYTGPLTTRTMALGTTLALLMAGCGSDNGNENQASGSATTASASASSTATGSSSSAPRTYENCEPGVETPEGYCVVVQFESQAFHNYENASGPADVVLEIGRQMMVRCRIEEQTIDSSEGGWYMLSAAEGDLAGYYIVANNEENGDEVGVPINRTFDPDIHVCADGERP